MEYYGIIRLPSREWKTVLIEVWKSGLFGPRKIADHLLVTIANSQPAAKFTRWSFYSLAIDWDFAASVLDGRVKSCPYVGMVAATRKLSQPYRNYTSYSAVAGSEITRFDCGICGYSSADMGNIQITPHPEWRYIAHPQRKQATIYEADFSGTMYAGHLVSPRTDGRLIICRFNNSVLADNLPSWVTKQFPDAELRNYWPDRAILEMPL